MSKLEVSTMLESFLEIYNYILKFISLFTIC